ncbi:MAG: DUF1573 domain-containing protein [Deltaproteobacteria bacterium]|nr:DUF1573 domain-containing protein [Deltaproteobacteria bacterium]
MRLQRTWLCLLLIAAIPLTVFSGSDQRMLNAWLEYQEIYEFGHIGLGYKVFHGFIITNQGDKPVRIEKVSSTCECNYAFASDSTIAPGDSISILMSFETTNYYGRTSRSVVVETDHPKVPEITFYHQSTIGQWYYNMKPDPISLFFLPGHSSRKIVLPNPDLERVELSGFEISHPHFDVKVVTGETDRGGQLELEILPRAELKAGTHLSSLTLTVKLPGEAKDYVLTIPVKIARF